ncbi:MAG TPA: dihydrofolate reductase family protein, partial [Actinomycetota bacterium]
EGNFDWIEPDDEFHAFINDLQRPVGTYLYGRRIYEVMSVFESDEVFESVYAEQGVEVSPAVRDFASIWRAAEKVVYSRTLEEVTTARTRLERAFDPEAVRELKASSAADLSIAGPELAAHALRAGLVDELQLTLSPVAVGGGKRALPDGLRIDLELTDELRFASGIVYLGYRVLAGD